MDSRRAEAFSDGVFAVAITVLVFDLLPIGHEALSYRVLAMGWPQYSAYVVSFMTIGIMWINHHTLFGNVRVIDRTLLVLNLLLLMGIVAIPFPTALVAEHLTGPTSSGGRPAAVVYGAVMLVISVSYNAIWVHLIMHADTLGYGGARRLQEAIPRVGPGQGIPRWSIGLGGYLAGTLIAAFWSAAAALAVYGLLALFYLFNHLPDPPPQPGYGPQE
jgi:uncharacterized membrane protein